VNGEHQIDEIVVGVEFLRLVGPAEKGVSGDECACTGVRVAGVCFNVRFDKFAAVACVSKPSLAPTPVVIDQDGAPIRKLTSE
jgi:hypothetical protein